MPKENISEEAPTNAVGDGAIAGAAPGETPPMRKKAIKKYQDRNKMEAPKGPVMSFSAFVSRAMGQRG